MYHRKSCAKSHKKSREISKKNGQKKQFLEFLFFPLEYNQHNNVLVCVNRISSPLFLRTKIGKDTIIERGFTEFGTSLQKGISSQDTLLKGNV